MLVQYAEILHYLQERHMRGEGSQVVDRGLMASHLAESSARHKSQHEWLALLESFKGDRPVGAFPLWMMRLASLRFRRRLVEIGERAQHGCADADLIEAFDLARAGHAIALGAEPLPFFDFSKEPPPVPEPLVGDERQQLIMPGEKTAVASDSGVGKTQLLIAFALGIASGKEVLGFRCRPRPVVYISSDGDPSIEMKIRRQWAGMGGQPEELVALALRSWADDGFCLEDETSFRRLRATLAQVGAAETPAVLILESLATNVRNTKLDDQASVRQFVNRYLGSLQPSFPGLSEIVSCHLRKPQYGGANDLGTRVAGSIQIRAAFDSIIGLTAAGKNTFSVMRVKRSRSGGDFEAFSVSIEGGRSEPLILRKQEAVNVTPEESRGAAKAVMAYMRRATSGPKTIEEIASNVPEFKTRAIQAACKKLSEAKPPLLTRTAEKPAAYILAPNSSDFDPGGLD